MKKFAAPFIFIAVLLLAVSSSAVAGDEADVKDVIKTAYIEGVHIESSPEKMRAGFHPDFTMSVLRDDKIVKVSLDDWIGRMEAGNKEKKMDAPKPNVTYEFPEVNVEGNAAVARVELHRDGKHIFTDYLSLYKFEDGWKIVAKIFHRH